MKFFKSSIVFSIVCLFTQGLAVPIAEAEAEPVPNPGPGPAATPENVNDLASRDPNWLKNLIPAPAPKNCPSQTNQCSTGVPYCCSTESGSHNCVKSNVNCQQKVICCNNNFGFQMCIGDIDFNMPINININL